MRNTCLSVKPDVWINISNTIGSIAENEISLPWPCSSAGTKRQADLMAYTKLEACS